jgi:hypothetical protein
MFLLQTCACENWGFLEQWMKITAFWAVKLWWCRKCSDFLEESACSISWEDKGALHIFTAQNMVTFVYGFIIFSIIVSTTVGMRWILVKLTALAKTYKLMQNLFLFICMFAFFQNELIRVLIQKQSIPRANPHYKKWGELCLLLHLCIQLLVPSLI